MASIPKSIVPKKDPIGIMAPIQPASVLVNGPLASGESFDNKIGNDGDSQPTAQPWLSTTTFADNENMVVIRRQNMHFKLW